MKPQTLVRLYRTENDTGPIRVKIQLKTDDGTIPLSDAYTVRLNVNTATVTTITGAAVGDSSGRFTFDPTDILTLSGNYGFNIEVEFAGVTDTVASGTLICFPDITA